MGRSFNILTPNHNAHRRPSPPPPPSLPGFWYVLVGIFWGHMGMFFSPFWPPILLICFGSSFAGDLPPSLPLTNWVSFFFYLSSLSFLPLIQSNPAGFISAPSNHAPSYLLSSPLPLFYLAQLYTPLLPAPCSLYPILPPLPLAHVSYFMYF